ncbi:uncharacterized protein LOC121382955 [Gigantopelta aegis]|uniref:uncharacterized protein LOC121382955 n=1 Tax=Gigantopelta aegis TaxID=1735272 RepID=UPI001B88E353|nr:uncharacterized protein LOC121382955 [Gigantopelta aegis]
MAGIITKSTSLNSFWSICYCFLVLGIHGYTAFRSISRYHEAGARAWPGSGGNAPAEVAAHVALIVLSFLFLPIFVLTSFIRVGNYANDGVKLGRDHALNSNMEALCKRIKTPCVKRFWQHLCPIAQTCHLISAFLLLLPETFVSAVEVEYGYKTTDAAWTSDLDFMFSPERAHISDVRASINFTKSHNSTLLVVPTPMPPAWGWTNRYSLGIAFVNFTAALLAFTVRYAAVFWYTNKVLSAIFGVQLFALSVTSLFGYSGVSILYRITYNADFYYNVTLSLACRTILVLYIFGGIIMVLSTITVFKYGAHYFEEKFKIVERKHHSESYIKQTIIVHSGCSGYVPHSCAVGALVLMAVCKGPILYDMVSAYRATKDPLILSSVVSEVVYMIMWIALWFGLTIKQKWKFRILDYVPLGQPVFMINTNSKENIMKNPSFDNDRQSDSSSDRPRSRQQIESPPGYFEALANIDGSDENERTHSDDSTEEFDNANSDSQLTLPNGGVMRKSKLRKNGGQRVTFDESVRRTVSSEEGSLGRSRTPVGGRPAQDSKRVNVTVDVHSGDGERVRTPTPVQHTDTRAEKPQNNTSVANNDAVVRRQNSSKDTLNKEYRNSIRNKCGEYYGNVNDLSSCSDDVSSGISSEPLPTLMSSFRDKVRESSLAANSYKEQRKLFGNNNSFEKSKMKPSNLTQTQLDDNSSKRRGIVEGEIGEVSLKINDIRLDDLGPLGTNCKRHSSCNSDSTSGASSLPLSADYTTLANDRNLVNGTPCQDSSLDRSSLRFNPMDKGEYLFPRPLHLNVAKKPEILGRRDSANYSLTSSQDTSSNDSEHGQGLCSQNKAAAPEVQKQS